MHFDPGGDFWFVGNSADEFSSTADTNVGANVAVETGAHDSATVGPATGVDADPDVDVDRSSQASLDRYVVSSVVPPGLLLEDADAETDEPQKVSRRRRNETSRR